ncbi:MAG: glycoside hydrolase family 30 protein [Myxococcota bacterium]
MFALIVLLSCSRQSAPAPTPTPAAVRVYLTSSAGDQMREMGVSEATPAATIAILSDQKRQVFYGVGGSLTQASAAALAELSPQKRRAVLDAYFGENGARYGLSRTHIASSDFSESTYTYAPEADPSLSGFSIEADRKNGLLALIKDARAAPGADFDLIASPWTAPPWMKDNNQFYDTSARRGGTLLEEHIETFANYLVAYIEAYRAEGIPIWAITPVNEPQGNGGSWESMDMSPVQQRSVVSAISTAFQAASLDTRVLIFDQNRKEMDQYTSVILGDPTVAPAVFGTAVHWYNSTFRVYEDVLDAQHAKYPDKVIIQSEGTADSLANPASCEGVCLSPPCGCEEMYIWWQNDPWYWQKDATDWGWDWANDREVDHPKYAPAMRYARDLVVGTGHWLSGWVDWNIVLNKRGGPNHVRNFCLAPVLVDGETDTVYYTPIFYVLQQFSRFSRPGGVVVGAAVEGPDGLEATAIENPDGSTAVHVFNDSGAAVVYQVQLGDRTIGAEIPNAALQTIVISP